MLKESVRAREQHCWFPLKNSVVVIFNDKLRDIEVVFRRLLDGFIQPSVRGVRLVSLSRSSVEISATGFANSHPVLESI